jgi:dihydrodipicolinate synthase/N-acetylneuraminate lyase
VRSGWEDLILPARGSRWFHMRLRQRRPELFVKRVRSAREDDLQRSAELHRRVLSLVTLGGYSDPPISAIELAMNKLGVPISPAVRGPALPIREEAHEKVESVLREAGLLTVREVG